MLYKTSCCSSLKQVLQIKQKIFSGISKQPGCKTLLFLYTHAHCRASSNCMHLQLYNYNIKNLNLFFISYSICVKLFLFFMVF